MLFLFVRQLTSHPIAHLLMFGCLASKSVGVLTSGYSYSKPYLLIPRMSLDRLSPEHVLVMKALDLMCHSLPEERKPQSFLENNGGKLT